MLFQGKKYRPLEKGLEIRLDQSLEADMQTANADLKLAESEKKRIEQLLNSKAASQADFEQAVNAVLVCKARVASLNAK